MTAEVHFVQGGEGPILIGSGDGTLSCDCGSALVEGFLAAQFLGVGIQCGRCGAVTTTLPLADGHMPPASLIAAAPSLEPRAGAMSVPPGAALVGQAEMERLGGLLRPVTPADWTYTVTQPLLDEAAAAFERVSGAALPGVTTAAGNAFAGLREHALGWAVQHLRGRIGDGSWACMENAPTANAVTHVTGFLHFVAAWSQHPLFGVMAATAGDRGFPCMGWRCSRRRIRWR